MDQLGVIVSVGCARPIYRHQAHAVNVPLVLGTS